ncbi:hypothetical protein E2C01_021473 [Portunus trituberculatus]|uniref:Uncharacterized protein n=1 Tax=Portunus trituberculatus TaxID=210409 RepID=A0A5B7E4Q9_PORTR|nr:hypothetical protein [Portunus trituberculatus]
MFRQCLHRAGSVAASVSAVMFFLRLIVSASPFYHNINDHLPLPFLSYSITAQSSRLCHPPLTHTRTAPWCRYTA